MNIFEICREAEHSVGSIVTLRGIFGTSRCLFPECAATRSPKTRSDWLFRDSFGCLYVTGGTPENLNPWDLGSLNRELELEAQIVAGDDKKIYLKYLNGEILSSSPLLSQENPTILGPYRLNRDRDGPPTFSISAGEDKKTVVEVATDILCFANRSKRSDTNFSESSTDDSRLTIRAYILPHSVWDSLKIAEKLYYRVGSISRQSLSDEYIFSTANVDASNAPFISIASIIGTVPSITTIRSFPNGSIPPTFTVNPGPNRYYVVEVTTNPYYFDYNQYGGGRTDDNFFGSWTMTPFAYTAVYPASYQLPQASWDRLRGSGATNLYYRLWATDSPNSWVNALSTTPDINAVSAPSFAVTRG